MQNFILGYMAGFLIAFIMCFLIPFPIKSDHPLTPQKEIKVDSEGDSTITYIYKLGE